MTDFATELDASAEQVRLSLSDQVTAKAIIARLPRLACGAAGGRPEQVDALARAWSEFYDAMRLMDGVQDAEVEQPARTLALATGLFLRACGRLTLLEAEAQRDTYARLMAVAEGQFLDVTDPRPNRQVALAIAENKTGAFFGLGLRLGAIAAGAPAEVATALTTFGQQLGTLVQLLDDLEWLEAARLGRGSLERGSNLAIAFGRERLSGEAADALERDLAAMAGDPEAARRAAAELIRAGARAWIALQAVGCARLALQALDAVPGEGPERTTLHKLVTGLIDSFRTAKSDETKGFRP